MHNVDMDDEMKVTGSEMEMVAKSKETLEQGGRGAHRFPKTLELAFNEYHRVNTLKHLRVALLTGLFLYTVFGIVDAMLLPADRAHMWLIRYAVVCPAIAAGLAFTYASRLKRFIQPVTSFVMLVASLGIVAMVYFDPTPTKNYYYSGILLLIMAAFTFISLRLLYAISWAIATTVAYEVVAIFANHTDPNILAQNSFNIIATIIIGAFSNYLMENYQRRDFLNALLLGYENRRLQKASHELSLVHNQLEQKVADRTLLLETALREQESFSYSVSHDLRAPLRHINSYNAIVLEDFGDLLPHEAHAFLDRSRIATQHMGKLIDGLLELSRISRATLAKGTVSLSDLATAVSNSLFEAEPHRAVEFVIGEGLLAQGDRSLLMQIMVNLLGNAWKYTATNPSVCIQFGKEVDGDKDIFYIKDNGVGFDMAYSDKLFGAFQRLHGSEYEGTGIGLATVKRIVDRHGGKVWADSKVNEGATFYFSL
jgi:signal transduction histidine kinase